MNPMKILLVDDSKSARYALRLQLQRYGVTVETEDAAESALERIRETPPDAIFMDHTMPGMNGFEALDILKATPATQQIPVVMCTSNDDPEFIAQAKKKGALDILSKSTAPEKLEGLLDRLQLEVASPASVPPAAVAEAQPVYPAPTKTQQAPSEAFTEERLDERIHASALPLMNELAERLKVDLAAQNEQTLISRLEEEADRLQNRFVKVQSEQAQLTANRLMNEVLPHVVQQQLDQEKQNIAHMVQELIDTSVDHLIEDPGFIRRLLDSVEGTAASNAERAVRHQTREIAETVASERAGEVAETLFRSSRPNSDPIYLLAAGAALVGVASAAVVYLLLS